MNEVRSPHGCLYGDVFIQSSAAADEDMRTIRFTRFFATHILTESILWLCIRFAPVSRFLSRIPVRPSAVTVNFRSDRFRGKKRPVGFLTEFFSGICRSKDNLITVSIFLLCNYLMYTLYNL